jgi:hypothetical protein
MAIHPNGAHTKAERNDRRDRLSAQMSLIKRAAQWHRSANTKD